MAAARLASWQPATPAALATYLTGHWKLTKAMAYVRGGVTSSFSGDAVFELLRHGERVLLSYEETGVLHVPGAQPLTGHRRLLWDCTSDPVSVYFDESHDRSPAAVVSSMRFFHPIHLAGAGGQPQPFEHDCPPDTYRGKLRFDAADGFCVQWDVQGPRKEGSITSEFKRLTCREDAF